MALSTQLLDAAPFPAKAPVVAPAIQPASAPVYLPAISVPMMPDPTIAPPPVGQYRGEGGTAFGSVPRLYVQPPVPGGAGDVGAIYRLPPNEAYNPALPAPILPETKPRLGDSTIQPVPRGDVPTKPAVQPAIPEVTVPKVPGPIKGNILGLDLALVPLWAWIVGAALLGARVLK